MNQIKQSVAVVLLAGIAAIALLGGRAVLYKQAGGEWGAGDASSQLAATARTANTSSRANLLNRIFSRGRCAGSGTRPLTAAPMRPEDVALVTPLGFMVKGHVTPIDHQYFAPVGFIGHPPSPEVPIFAPADGTIVMVNRFPLQQIEGHLEGRDGYDIVIEYSCDFYSKLGLLTGLTDELAKKVGPIPRGGQKYVRIPVKAGEKVARVGGQTLDLFTYDLNTPKKRWIVPEHYDEGEGEKKYITDVFLYLSEPVKSKLMAKNPRASEPRGGRFDYDIDGRLVGTWFRKGTGGYTAGDPSARNYWKGHLVFAYNVLDASSTEISMGSWGGDDTGHQFAVKDRAPDPKDVAIESGLIKYELAYAYFLKPDGEPWNQLAYVGPVRRRAGESAGTIIVQMLGSRLIKVEKFPGKTPAEVSSFTSAAELYER